MSNLIDTLKEHQGRYSAEINAKILELVLILEERDNYSKPSLYVFQFAANCLLRQLLPLAKENGVDVRELRTVSWRKNNKFRLYGSNRFHSSPKAWVIKNAINKYFDVIWGELEPHEKSFLCSLGEKADAAQSTWFELSKLEIEGCRFIAIQLYTRLLNKYKLARRCNQLTLNHC